MNRKGFTLVELGIVIAILAIIIALVFPVISGKTSGPRMYKTVCYQGPDIVFEQTSPIRARYETSEYYQYGDKLIYANHCINTQVDSRVVESNSIVE